MRTFFVLATLALTPPLALGCGVRWTPNQEYVAQTHADPAAAYAKVLQVVNERGYQIVEQHDADRSVRVRAHVNENFVSQNSFITASVDPRGNVTFTPSGHLVRGNKIHKLLAQELEDLRNATGGNASEAPPAPAAVATTDTPPSPTASEAPAASAAPVGAAPAVPAEAAKPAPKSASKASGASKPQTAPKTSTKPAESPKADDDWVPVK